MLAVVIDVDRLLKLPTIRVLSFKNTDPLKVQPEFP